MSDSKSFSDGNCIVSRSVIRDESLDDVIIIEWAQIDTLLHRTEAI